MLPNKWKGLYAHQSNTINTVHFSCKLQVQNGKGGVVWRWWLFTMWLDLESQLGQIREPNISDTGTAAAAEGWNEIIRKLRNSWKPMTLVRSLIQDGTRGTYQNVNHCN